MMMMMMIGVGRRSSSAPSLHLLLYLLI